MDGREPMVVVRIVAAVSDLERERVEPAIRYFGDNNAALQSALASARRRAAPPAAQALQDWLLRLSPGAA